MKKIDKAIEILQAFKERKPIEYRTADGRWLKVSYKTTSESYFIEHFCDFAWRVKSEPTYRPYANAEEFLKDSKEHGPYLKNESTKSYCMPTSIDNESIWHIYGHISFIEVLKKYPWQDGTPCGVKEE